MKKITIEKVTENDADFLFGLMNDTLILKRLNEVPTSREEWVEAVLAWENDDDENNYIVWEDDKQIGWFAVNGLQSADRTAYLKMAVMLPEYQNKGIGTYVLSKLIKTLRENGYVSVMLFTNKDNENAQSCYRKCGFEAVEYLNQKMADGSVAERCRMECRLGR